MFHVKHCTLYLDFATPVFQPWLSWLLALTTLPGRTVKVGKQGREECQILMRVEISVSFSNMSLPCSPSMVSSMMKLM